MAENDRHSNEKVDTGWTPIQRAMPSSGSLVEVLTPGGDQRKLTWDRNLWWLPDRSMYVYFTPTHWRSLPPESTTGGAS